MKGVVAKERCLCVYKRGGANQVTVETNLARHTIAHTNLLQETMC